jgi:hypothetical protein
VTDVTLLSNDDPKSPAVVTDVTLLSNDVDPPKSRSVTDVTDVTDMQVIRYARAHENNAAAPSHPSQGSRSLATDACEEPQPPVIPSSTGSTGSTCPTIDPRTFPSSAAVISRVLDVRRSLKPSSALENKGFSSFLAARPAGKRWAGR